MKSPCLSCLLICLTAFAGSTQPSTAQSDRIFHLRLRGSALLSAGTNWKYHPGDNLAWAQPAYDDHQWQRLDPNLPASQLPQAVSAGSGWWRLRLTIDAKADLPDAMLALLITQYGASEIYLDGRLISRLGIWSPETPPMPFNPHNRPLPLPIDQGASHLLAIRFASDAPAEWIRQRAGVSPISLHFQSLQAAIGERDTLLKRSRITVGFAFVAGAIGLLFLLLYGFYAQQRLNLFFGLFGLIDCLLLVIGMLLAEGSHGLTRHVLLSYGMDLAGRVVGSNALVFVLLALYHRVGRPYRWMIFYIFVVDFPLALAYPQASFQVWVNVLFRGVWTGAFVWLTIDAFRRRNREDWLAGLVAFASMAINTAFLLLFLTGIDITAFALSLNILLIFPSMMLYLALRYGRANTSLAQQLVQVQHLSEKSLQQEQEKQHLLAEQNQTLERQVEERTVELTQQKEALQATLAYLKITQAQLIQKEKMASLGELTAGIAHEIQNPLNFVNNFAEVSQELVEELKEGPIQQLNEVTKEEAEAILSDLEQNLSKIYQHGQRADAIVKGMLQHSRSTTGEKQPTDLNALAEEYLRLSYHGLRANDQEFNAILVTDFDATLGQLEVVPQEIGRVLLNLFNNAFYATQQKKVLLNGQYEPTVQVRTKKLGNQIEIRVKDNGMGIPENVKSKIFQPFFTTKPPGQGTGLGLSLSYDIITKGHSGELRVESQEGDSTEFIVNLPIQ